MGERRALVIGARNDRFGVLDFVDDVARELHRTLLDAERGACLPALPGGRDLLLGDMASSAGIDSALADSIAAAAADQATLFVYFLGHGQRGNQDFYLIGTDTSQRVDSRTAVQIGQRVKELLHDYATVDGLMLVLDACHSGAAISDPVPGLLRSGVNARLEILAATREDQTASRGCFTRGIVALLTNGSPAAADEYLTAYDEHSRLGEAAPPDCADMPTTVHMSIRGGPDAGLWLGRNRAADLRPALLGTQDAAQVARLTRGLVRTSYLRRLMKYRWSSRSPIAVIGPPGVGKSVLLSALGRASVAGENGVDALVAVRPGDTLVSVTMRLTEQLRKSPAFQRAAARWAARTPEAVRDAASVFDSAVSGPIRQLVGHSQLLIGVDGIDQMGTLDRRRLLEAFTGTPEATLIVTGRTAPDVDTENTVELPAADPDAVGELLESLVDDTGARSRIAEACAGEWLLARILADQWRAGHFDPLPADAGPDEVFSVAVAVAKANMPDALFDDVLAVLATAPPGAWMPLDLLTAALAARADQVRVRDILVALGELVGRADPGTDLERVGPAHELIATHLRMMAGEERLAEAHARVADAILAQADSPTPGLLGYARQRLADHLWWAGHFSAALEAIPTLDTPADTLSLWQLWRQRVAGVAPDHPVAVVIRRNIGIWAHQAGDLDLARTELAALLPDETRILGPDHRRTLETRLNIAIVTGDTGDAREALNDLKALLPDLTRLFGPDDNLTLRARRTMATLTERAGNLRRAVKLYSTLLPDLTRVLGPDDRATLGAQVNAAALTGAAGDAQGALEQLDTLVADLMRVVGPDDELTLTARNIRARFTREAGDPAEALSMYKKLLADRTRLLGPDHLSTLVTRAGIAQSLGEVGDVPGALKEYNALLNDQTRALGADHPETLTGRHNIAMWGKQAGDLRGAVEQLAAVHDDRARVLGPQHPDTIITRENLDRYRDSLTTSVLIVALGDGQKLGQRPQSREGPKSARRRRPGS
jgi:hypothetical protein